MHVLRFTESFRKEELERGRRSLWYFGQSILGFGDLAHEWSDVQYDLCTKLEGRPPHLPWRRLVVAVYRSGFKSSVATEAYPWWRILYIEDFSVKIIENSSDNAKVNHFRPMVDLFTTSPRAEYLRWLYSHRIPGGDWPAGWNSQQVQMKKGSDPFAAPSITYWGLESKKEGWHGDLVILDDADGADAEKNPEKNLDAFSAYQGAIPLLKNPATGQILIVGTSWGPNPLIWQLREREAGGSLDNRRRSVHVFWRPLKHRPGDPSEPDWKGGVVAEPKRFTPAVVAELDLDPKLRDTQYQLQKSSSSLQLFDMTRVEESYYEYIDPERSIIRYRGFELTDDAVKALREGDPLPELTQTEETVALSECWAFLTCDPTHKHKQLLAARKGSGRPSKAAILATVVAPDSHVFSWRTWSEDCPVEKLREELFRFYRLTGAMAVSWETVGAQIWLKTLIEDLERSIPALRHMETVGGAFGPPRLIPRLSQRMVEFDRGNDPKADLYRSQLASWVNSGLFHLHRDHTELYDQLANALNEKHAVDLVDCAAQGPAIWKTPPAPDTIRRFRERRRWAERRTQKKNPAGRFSSPWRRPTHPAGLPPIPR